MKHFVICLVTRITELSYDVSHSMSGKQALGAPILRLTWHLTEDIWTLKSKPIEISI